MNGMGGAEGPFGVQVPSASDVPVALVVRHAHCQPAQPATLGNEVPISCRGAQEARVLGGQLRARHLTALMSSPLPRCMQTARCLAEGAEWDQRLMPNTLLGHPGAFVSDAEQAGPCFLEHGPEEIVRRLLRGEPLPGLRPIADGVALLMDLILPKGPPPGGTRVFVTHDSVLAPLVLHLLGRYLGPGDWPEFLDYVAVCRESGGLAVAWRGEVHWVSQNQ